MQEKLEKHWASSFPSLGHEIQVLSSAPGAKIPPVCLEPAWTLQLCPELVGGIPVSVAGVGTGLS